MYGREKEIVTVSSLRWWDYLCEFIRMYECVYVHVHVSVSVCVCVNIYAFNINNVVSEPGELSLYPPPSPEISLMQKDVFHIGT